MATTDNGYVLRRDLPGSIRLDAQHALWMIHSGWTMNPRIPISPDMKIADMGTGTGIWLLDLSTRLPESVTLDGFDISPDQFPPQSLLPPNVTLATMDGFSEPPPHLVGRYDVVHLRFWALIVTKNDPSRVIRHAMMLLKPGGYIQWEDANNGGIVVRGNTAAALHSMMQRIDRRKGFEFDWLSKLDEHARRGGFNVLESYQGPLSPAVVPLATLTLLGAVSELSAGLDMDRRRGDALPGGTECREALADTRESFRKGEALFHWTAVTLLAQKPTD